MRESLSLQQIVLDVAHNLHDCVEGVTTASMGEDRAKMRDALRAVAGDDHYNGSEVLFLQPGATAAGLTGANPKAVLDFQASDGTFTLNDAWGSTGVPAGVAYALLRIGGEGHPYAEIVAALRQALSALSYKSDVYDESLVVVAGQPDYTVPAGIDWLTAVTATNPQGFTAALRRPQHWDLRPGTRTLRLTALAPVSDGYTLGLQGQTDVVAPAALDGTITVDREEVVGATIEFLLRGGSDKVDLALAGNLYADRVRTVPRYRRSNSVRVG